MAEVKVRTADVELRTAKLSKSILKQMPVATWERVKHLLKKDGGICPDAMPGSPAPQSFIGWVHGSVLEANDEQRWLIVNFGDGVYGRFSAMPETLKGVPQIYIV